MTVRAATHKTQKLATHSEEEEHTGSAKPRKNEK